ncbi:MAG: B12-binding domain-containing radical SAM protein [Candidatus Omnitrophota bacterium]
MPRSILLCILPVFWPKMPPLGLACLQEYLISKDISCDILDLNNLFYNLADARLKKEWLKSCNIALEREILKIILRIFLKEFNLCLDKMLGYEVVGFSCFKSNFDSTQQVTRMLLDKSKNIKIVYGGPEISRQYFKSTAIGKGIGIGREKQDSEIATLADFLVVGEGEKPLYDYLKGENKNRVSRFNELHSLSGLNFPKYVGLKFDDYPANDALSLQFSRGCVKRCSFCSERLLYKGFRTRRVVSVIDELSYHKKASGIKNFIFFDSLINGDLKKLEDLCQGIISAFGKVNWEAQLAIRSDMPGGLLKKIKESGCYHLFVGLESGSGRVLKMMNKGYSPKEAAQFLRKLKSAGLSYGVSMIVGYPGESQEDFMEGLDFVLRNKSIIPKIEQINPYTYYDGTSLDKQGDYKFNQESLEKMQYFVQKIREHGFKYTRAFLGNLIEKC